MKLRFASLLVRTFKTPAILSLVFFVSVPTFVFAAFGGGEPTVFTPNPFSGDTDSLRVDGPTGAFTQQIPIVIPPGRNGIQPEISLTYNSQKTEDSIVGYGWGLTIPYIERQNKTGSEDLYTSDAVFSSFIDGELSPTATSSLYRPRIDGVSSHKYIFSNNTWTVYDKKGTQYIYGVSDDGRLYNTAASSTNTTFRWMLEEIRDVNGNYITYTYSRESNELYPYLITYTGHNTTAGPFTVSFATSTRADVRENYKPGFKVTTNYRISQIDVSISGTLVNRYALSYGTGVNGKRSLLSSVQRTGYDESSTATTLPAFSFTYASSSEMFVTPSDEDQKVIGPAYVVADVDGNGQNDVSHLFLDGSSVLGTSLINQTTLYQNFSTPRYWSETASYSGHLAIENGARFVDINGDGKADVIESFQDDQTSTKTTSVYLGNGDRTWTSTTTYSGIIPAFGYKTSGGSIFTTGLLSEINGDGLVDFVKAVNGYGGGYTFVGNGFGFATSTAFSPAMTLPTSGFSSNSSSQLIDINADGLSDWLYSDDSNTYARLNNGSGWNTATSSQWTIATSTYYHSTSGGDEYYDRGIRFIDLNGDNLPDFVRAYNLSSNPGCTSGAQPEFMSFKHVMLNTGNGWATSSQYTLPEYIVNGWINSTMSPCGPTGLKRNEYANWIGNGQMNQEVITQVTRPEGGTKTITYTPSTQLSSNQSLPVSLLVVTAVSENDGFGTIGTTTYEYGGGAIYREGSAFDRKFAGFAIATSTSPDTKSVRFYHQGDTANTMLGERADGFPYIGRPFREDILDLLGALKKRTYTRWDINAIASTTFVGLGNEMIFDYDSNGAHRDSATEYLYATTSATTNDLVRKIEYGEVSGITDGTFSDSGSDKRVATISYAATTTSTTTQSAGNNPNSYALEFEKDSSQYANRTSSLSGFPNDGSNKTIEAWVKFESLPTSGAQAFIVDMGNNSDPGGNNGEFNLAIKESGGNYVGFVDVYNRSVSGTASLGISTGQWYHYAVVYNGTNFIWYINGVEKDSKSAGTVTSNVATVGVGARAVVGYAGGFDGIADDVRIWNTARTQSQLDTNKSTELNGNETGLISYWKLNNSSNDLTSNGNNLTLQASPTYTADVGFVSSSTTTVTFTSLSTPSQETLTNQSGTTAKETRYYYDGLSLGSITTGNMTKRDTWVSGSTYASDQFVYNTYGLIASSTDPRGNITTNTYDSRNLYVATSTNALSQQTQFYYDYTLGKLKQTIDLNGFVFETTYDGLDRPTVEKQPDLTTPSTLVNKKTYTYTDTVGSRKVVETNYLDGSTDFTLYKYFDGLDRVIQTRKEAESDFSTRDFVYSSSGLLHKESLPYFSSGSAKTSATGTENLYTTYTYDALRRVLTAANAVGTTTNVYEAWSATTTDAGGNNRGMVYDALKRLIKVIEYNDGASYSTQYQYDIADNLTNITDAQSNTRNFTYDGRGKRLTAQDLHESGDGTFGTWTYVYDLSGNLASTTDPKSQQIDYAYDALNRPTSENFTGLAGNEVEYAYDSCTYGVGKLCTATSTGAVAKFTYNALGLPATEQKTIENTIFTTSFTYNRQGSPTAMVYPDNSEVQYTYNTAGLPEMVTQKQSGGTWWPVVSDFDYGPHEKITYKEFGNGATTTLTYDASALYRLTNIFTSVGATSTSNGGGTLGFAWDSWKNFVRADDQPFAFFKFPRFYTFALTDEEVLTPSSEVVEEPILPPTEEITATADETVTDELITPPTEEVLPTEDMLVDVVVVDEQATMTPEIPVLEPEPASEIIIEVATSTSEASTTTKPVGIYATLFEKTPPERTVIKSHAIANLGAIEKTDRPAYKIEVLSLEDIEGGVQAFVRAWDKEGRQIGFGADGSIDIERFRIFNPPILVPDDTGEVVREWDEEQPDGAKVKRQQRMREDVEEAILQVIEQNLSVMKNIHGEENIIQGKVGKTTSTFYPSLDGHVLQDIAAPRATWAAIHDDTTSDIVDDTGTVLRTQFRKFENDSDPWNNMTRVYVLFDSSALGDSDIIASATLSLYSASKIESGAGFTPAVNYGIVSSNPASNTALAVGDYDPAKFGTTDFATRVAYTAITTSVYADFALNASGISNISKTGLSKFGVRVGSDIDNSEPSGTGDTYREIYFSSVDITGTTQDPKLVIEHSPPLDNVPSKPTSLLTEGTTEPTSVTDPTPEFSAIYNDPDLADSSAQYRLQVSTTTMFSATLWDSTKTTMATTSKGSRSPDISYAGSSLASSTVYFWRIKFWDVANNEGEWSDPSLFVLSGGTPTISNGIQDLSYTYDALGNITRITDTSNTESRKTAEYVYDDLNRLTYAYTTVASTSPYGHVYAYDSLGNFTSKSDVGEYQYTGTTTGNYANPHAPTLIGTSTLSYDYNGNLTNYASTTNEFDFRNRLIATHSSSSPSATFGYDHTNNRVFKGYSGATTTLPSKYYNIEIKNYATSTATTTKSIFTPSGELIATVTTVGATSTRKYIHTDHLGGMNAGTDSNGDTVEVADTYPYGAPRISETYGAPKAQRQFAGTERDLEQSVDYMINRYYSYDRGQFLSEDPVHWEIGMTSDGKKAMLDPQLQNSYAYARGNPITNKDPDGRAVYFASRPVPFGIAQYGVASHIYYYVSPEAGSAYANIGSFTLGGLPQGPIYNPGNLVSSFGAVGSNGDSKSGLLNARQITVPEGQTEDALIKSLYMGSVAVANAGVKYSATGGYNSNSYARTLAQYGGILGQFNSYASQFNLGGVNTAPGSGRAVAPPGLAALLFPGMPNFQGTYDFGPNNGGVVDFGKTQSSTPPSKNK